MQLIFSPPQKYIQPLQNVKAGYGHDLYSVSAWHWVELKTIWSRMDTVQFHTIHTYDTLSTCPLYLGFRPKLLWAFHITIKFLMS